ncbi:hypothetical protein ND860_17900 [Leptospira levettii]|uniref:hypothetical protein n=1 Tax=Leptospira levettii TaxID=2023178 RepID=UPI00223D8463|nr:hypothetical protein [Leptospira levettii]MCW7498415.1 hypothetical protein [Leptospira levettii]
MKTTTQFNDAIKEFDNLVSKSNFKNYKKVLNVFRLGSDADSQAQHEVMEDSLRKAILELEKSLFRNLYEDYSDKFSESIPCLPRLVFRIQNDSFFFGDPYLVVITYIPEQYLLALHSMFEVKFKNFSSHNYARLTTKVYFDFQKFDKTVCQMFKEYSNFFETSNPRTFFRKNLSRVQFVDQKASSREISLKIAKKLHEALDQSIQSSEKGIKIELSPEIRKKVEKLRSELISAA